MLRITLVTLILAIGAFAPASALAAWNTNISASATSNVSALTAAGTTTFTATGTGANLSKNDLENAIQTNDVVVDSGSTGADTGTIADVVSLAPFSFPNHSLTFKAAGDISIPNQITTGGA